MADLEVHNPEFDITVDLEQGPQTITVHPDETSDGVEYYKCSTGTTEITQIRLDENGDWEQIWGDLSQSDISAIGKVIEENK